MCETCVRRIFMPLFNNVRNVGDIEHGGTLSTCAPMLRVGYTNQQEATAWQ